MGSALLTETATLESVSDIVSMILVKLKQSTLLQHETRLYLNLESSCRRFQHRKLEF